MTTKCETFDELQHQVYLSKNKTLLELPATSRSIQYHLLLSHYGINFCLTLLDTTTSPINALNFGWESINGILIAQKGDCPMPEEYTSTCVCQKGCQGRCGWRKTGEPCTEYCSRIGCTNTNNSTNWAIN